MLSQCGAFTCWGLLFCVMHTMLLPIGYGAKNLTCLLHQTGVCVATG